MVVRATVATVAAPSPTGTPDRRDRRREQKTCNTVAFAEDAYRASRPSVPVSHVGGPVLQTAIELLARRVAPSSPAPSAPIGIATVPSA